VSGDERGSQPSGTSNRRLHPSLTSSDKDFAIVEEVRAITFFLASDAAAAIAGVVGRVDGGWTAR
jgi:NAD(P)-dependent dehydrogenase (short-subunit alcohol dehydrogenase family)